MHDFFGRHLRLNGVQEADELLVTMALHTSANDLAFEDIESSEQRRCAMALVVVGHRAGSAFLHRQAGLGAVERLDLRLFVDREDDGMGGRIDIKPDNIAQLVDELRVVGKLELVDPVRLETMRALTRTDPPAEATHWTATSLAISDPSGGMREGRVLSRKRPS